MNRIILVCKILFGFNDNDLLEDNINNVDLRWNQSPNKIIEFVGKYLLEDQTYSLIPHIEKEYWIKYLNEPIEVRRDDIDQLFVNNQINNIIEDKKNLCQFVGVTGKKFNGKDTISNYLCDKYGYNRIAYADPLKEVCRIIFQFDNEQLYGNKKEQMDEKWKITPRHIYQYIGTELFRKQMYKIIPEIKNNFWVKCLNETIKKELKKNPHKKFVVSDIRFQNEIDILKNEFIDCKIIRVKRSSVKYIDNHESELLIDNLGSVDFEINNDGNLNELYENVDKLFDKL